MITGSSSSTGADRVARDPLTANETARLVRSGEVSALEVVEEALARLDQVNPALGAVTYVAGDQAREAAGRLDRRIRSGKPVGALAGVPTLVKDLYGFVPGWPATLGGITALQDHRAPDGLWSAYPRAVVAADAILIGQSNSPVLGFRGVTDNALFGPTRNPFDTARNAGGSSGGAAAAVAAGIVPVAGGSDAGGSIRIPAAWTNTVGFQPTAGRVPSVPRPVGFHLAPYLYEGPITRTVRDAAIVTDVLSRHDPYDPTSFDGAPNMSDALNRDIDGLRIGFTDDFGGFPVDPAVRAVVAQAATALEELAKSVTAVPLRLGHSHNQLTDTWLRMMGTLMLSELDNQRDGHVDLTAGGGVPEQVLRWTDRATTMTVREVLADRATRTAVLDGFVRALEDVDLIVGPTVGALPIFNSTGGRTVGPSEVDGIAVDPLIGWCPTYLTNFTGMPSISVPAGFAGNLPVGLLIIGRKYRDADVFAAAAAFERARPWYGAYRQLVVNTHGTAADRQSGRG